MPLTRSLSVALALLCLAGCGANHVRARPITNKGQLLWEFEALLHDTFGNRQVCASGRWAQRFTSGACSPLAVYSPYWYVFADAHHSTFHVTDKQATNFGNYPQPVLVDGKNIACDKASTRFLITYVDAASLTLGCSAAGYVR